MKKVIVIGAGVAGLCAATKLSKNGYEVTIIEKNNFAGGLATGYYKNGFYIDACLHWLMGTKNNTIINSIWKDIGGITDDTKIIRLDNFATFEMDGKTVRFGRDLNKTEQEWLEISPIDKKEITKFFNCIRALENVWNVSQQVDKEEHIHFWDLIKNSKEIYRGLRKQRDKFSLHFKSKLLQFAIKYGETGYNNTLFFMLVYASFCTGDSNVPYGGIIPLINRVKEYYLSLGGELLLNEEVKEILTIDNKAVGVVTNNGTYYGDYVISAVDPIYTLDNLLKKKYRFKKYEKLDKKVKKNPISSCFNVFIGVHDYKNDIEVPTVLSINPIKVGTKSVDGLLIRPYSFDDSFFKGDSCVVSFYIDQDQADFNYYKNLKESYYANYKKEKAEEIINIFLKRYPQYKNKVELLTCFTPLELNKLTNTRYGALQAYSFTDKSFFYEIDGTLKGLDNFYMCTQWNRSIGGSPSAILAGNKIADKILKNSNK